MIFNTLSIQGFRSFDEYEVFDFVEGGQGFFYISGDNQVEPRLGSNGAGKSTVFEALCWVLYGKMSSNVKAGNVKSWTSKKRCKVILSFEKNDESCTIERTQSPNKTTLTVGSEGYAEVKTQEEIEDFVGLNFQSFLFSVFVSQFSNKFFDLIPSDKLGVFSQTLDLDKWLDRSDRADKIGKQISDKIFDIDVEVTEAKGKLEGLQEQDYTVHKDNWAKDRDERLKEEKETYDTLVKLKGRDTKALSVMKKGHRILSSNNRRLKDKKENAEGALTISEEMVIGSMNIITRQDCSMSALQQSLRGLDGVGAVCSECKQKVSKAHIKKEKEKINDSLNILKDDIVEIKKKHKKLLDIEVRDIEDLEDLRELQSLSNENAINSMNDMSNIKGDLEDYDRDMADLHSTIEDINKEKNPYVQMIKDCESRKKKVKTLLRDNTTKRLNLREEEDMYMYWKKGFKEIRLFVINEALDELQMQMNNSLQELGLEGWEIILMVDRETKSKTISKGFTIMVKSPNNDELVPFECWSGGEAQRLKIAGTLAMSDFIRMRTGEDWNLEVFDEPTAWLSREGIEDMLEILRRRTDDNNRKTYMIDHRDFEAHGDFDGQFRIVKNETGSHIICV